MDGLTVKEVAALKGCSVQAVRKMIKDGKLETVETKSPANGRLQYLAPVETLPEDLRAKYYASIHADAPAMPAPAEKPKPKGRAEKAAKPFEEYSQAEREEIMLWTEILEVWQNKRSLYASVTEGDANVLGWLRTEYPQVTLSVDILYRKWHYYKVGQLDGLLDGRGKWGKGKSSVPQEVWDQFLWYYLDQNQRSVSLCYRSATEAAMEFWPELVATLPSEQAFRRKLKAEVPQAVLAYLRKGEKACFDAYAPYIERLYDQLEANDVWIADNHTWDIMVKTDDTEVVHRMYITGFLDAKSGAMMGWNVTDNPCSDSTIFALRQGILKHGIPKVCYFDNGTEFLTMDIAGRGHRTRKSKRDLPKPETILARLGIEMRNAQVRNAKAKPIERSFYTLKEHISKLMDSYCGGTPAERPEKLKRLIKDGEVPTDSRFREMVDTLVAGIYNMEPYGGSETGYDGMTRMDVWNASIKRTVQRIADPDDLNLMLMRSTQYQKVKRNGVYITLAGEKLWYNSGEDMVQTMAHVGDTVYVRYDPTDLRQVRIYNEEDRYLWTWTLENTLLLNFMDIDYDAVGDANAKVARNKRGIRDLSREFVNIDPAYKIDILDLNIRKAKQALEDATIERSNVIQPIRPRREKEVPEEAYPMAVGGGTIIPIDIDRMNANAAKNKR